MCSDLEARLQAATELIVGSDGAKKLIVAGPGSGKTYTFRALLEQLTPSLFHPEVLTFINTLRDDLHRDLSDLARVSTFHSYCLRLLHARSALRGNLTGEARVFPQIMRLISVDWEIARGGEVPKFIGVVREVESDEATEFFVGRSDYYDAVAFDDCVYRVYNGLVENPEHIPKHALVLIDEYQDFNRLEASFIDLLATSSPIVIVGDDDQAVYARLKGATPEFIRGLHSSGEYEIFELPFSMRCPEPIVGAVHDILEKAQSIGCLSGRIQKPYEYYPPKKGDDTASYPVIHRVTTSVQANRTNYFGRYIEEKIRDIPPDEIEESHKENFPTALVIGPNQYLRQVQQHLEEVGYECQARDRRSIDLERDDALSLLRRNSESNLGWRALIEVDQPSFGRRAIERSVDEVVPMIDLIDPAYRDAILRELAQEEIGEEVTESSEIVEPTSDPASPTIRLASFEGSKGLSAQHVFIVGVHNGDIPVDPDNIDDLEICKFLVGLTRTRKQCHVLHCWRWSGRAKKPSVFLDWISDRTVSTDIDKTYWD